MKKFRVLLHSMTFLRDFGSMYVLSKLLESMGCECFIASNINYVSRWIRLFNPHAVFYVTANRTELLAKTFPRAKLFLCAGEGAEDDMYFDEKCFIENPKSLDYVERMFLWGRNTARNIDLYSMKNNSDQTLNNLIKSSDEKIVVAGHPRLDLVRFGKRKASGDGRIRVGLIGNAAYANGKALHPLSLVLLNDKLLDLVHYGFNLNLLYLKIIRELPAEQYAVSLRPYPLERRETYEDVNELREKGVKIDYSVDFSTWLNEQDIIVGDYSSTLVQIVLSNKKYINISDMVLRPEDSYMFNLIGYFKDYTAANRPKSFDELMQMIKNSDKVPYDEKLIELFDDMYSIKNDCSVLLRIAKEICADLSQKGCDVGWGAPVSLLQCIDKMKYGKVTGCYSFFRLEENMPYATEHLQPIAEAIMQSSPDDNACLD